MGTHEIAQRGDLETILIATHRLFASTWNKAEMVHQLGVVVLAAGRMVVDYRKVNTKIVFDSYPLPTIDQAFEQLGGPSCVSSPQQL